MVEQDPRVRRAAGGTRLPGGWRGRVPAFRVTRWHPRWTSFVLTWATGGQAAGPKHWPPIVARRKEILERQAEWNAASGAGGDTGGGHGSDDDHALGRDQRACAGVGAPAGRRARAGRAAASTGVIEGVARVVRSVNESRGHPRRRDPGLRQHVAGLGADLLEDQGHGHRCRRRDVARGDRVSRVRTARRGGDTWPRDRPLPQIHTGQTIRVDGTDGVVTLLARVTRTRAAWSTAVRWESCDGATSRSSAARASASVSCWRRDSRAARIRALHRGVSHAFIDDAGLAAHDRSGSWRPLAG